MRVEDKQRRVTLLRERIDEAQDGEPADFNGWKARSESALRIALGRDHPIVEQFHGIRYGLAAWSESTPASAWRDAQRSGIRQRIALLEGAALEVEHSSATNGDDSTAVASTGGVVFVVHGHDEARTQMAVRAVQQMTGEPPIILHEQPDRGRTIIEKLEDHAATASFAIVLLTGDDKGASKNATRTTPRARQNVVFEAGLFVGLLGRERVVLLYEQDVELPSDLHGVLFKEIDTGGAWRYGLGREMRAAGLCADIRLEDTELIDPKNTPVPLTDGATWDLYRDIYRHSKVVRLGNEAAFSITRGEINQTIYRKFIKSNPTMARLLKGVEVGQYRLNKELSQGEREWFDERNYLLMHPRRSIVDRRRIATQRITGVDERLRLVATIVDPPMYFADSTNSVVLKKKLASSNDMVVHHRDRPQ